MSTFLTVTINTLLIVSSLFLICLILIQRGKGGGLAGAFGGMGGSSAFGTKAGDVFTRVTIWVALVWGILAVIQVVQLNQGTESAWGNDAAASKVNDADAKSGKGKSKDKGTKSAQSSDETPPAPTDAGAPPVSLPAALPDETSPAPPK